MAMKLSCPRYPVSSVSATLTNPNSKLPVDNLNTSKSLGYDGPEARIKRLFEKTELSVSAYDTAWVAMLASPDSSKSPCFPECTRWILENQFENGSWGLPRCHPLLVKDYLSSTLACILALKQWGIGEQQINKGLQFIELNSASVMDEKQLKPIGFDIIFPSMVEFAKDIHLNIPLNSKDIDSMLYKRDLELRSNREEREAYFAFVSEGIGKLQDWDMVMKYQRKNGSLFNSPSTTAAAFLHIKNADCLLYIQSLVEKFGNAVPTVYPLDIYARLCMVDTLESLGIGRHFKKEIKIVLDEICSNLCNILFTTKIHDPFLQTNGCWLCGDEDIFLDATTCAMAFRVLRVNGYDVSPDLLMEFTEDDHSDNSLGGYLKGTRAALELYKASQIIFPDESLLEKISSWARDCLKKKLSDESVHKDGFSDNFGIQVLDALNNDYHADLERLNSRRNIEHYGANDTRLLKTSYRCSSLENNSFLQLAVDDFNTCQSIQHEELAILGRWVIDNRLDKLNFARQKLEYCYFSSAATAFAPELSDARLSWTKNGVLTTVVDDFFDIGGSEEELVNLIQLIEKWDINGSTGFCSEQVEIIFSALHNTICEIGKKAFAWQGRNVTNHIHEIWLDLLHSMLIEAQWTRNTIVPTLEEYMSNSYVSFALGPIVLPALYFVGPKLSDEVILGTELHTLFKTMSTCGRLLNDWRGFKRESSEGKLNAVSLNMITGGGNISKEEAIQTIKGSIESHRKELCRLVLEEKESKVPRACKDMFWKMIKVLHFFYKKDDGFSSNDMMSIANSVINKPITLNL